MYSGLPNLAGACNLSIRSCNALLICTLKKITFNLIQDHTAPVSHPIDVNRVLLSLCPFPRVVPDHPFSSVNGVGAHSAQPKERLWNTWCI